MHMPAACCLSKSLLLVLLVLVLHMQVADGNLGGAPVYRSGGAPRASSAIRSAFAPKSECVYLSQFFSKSTFLEFWCWFHSRREYDPNIIALPILLDAELPGSSGTYVCPQSDHHQNVGTCSIFRLLSTRLQGLIAVFPLDLCFCAKGGRIPQRETFV